MSKNPPPESSCPSEEISLSSSYSSEEEEEQQQQLTTAKSVIQPALDTCLDPTSATKNHDKEGESESHIDESKQEQSGSLSKKPQQLSTPASPKLAPKSDSDSDSDSESSSDSEHVSDSDFETAKKPDSSTPVPSKPASDSGYKSECVGDSDANAAKLEKPTSSKTVAEVLPVSKMGDGSSKKSSGRNAPLIHLIWSEADEIAVLEGMTAFQSQHGPIILAKSSVSDFLTFIKGSISLQEIIADQLVDKLKRMKKSYHSVVSRANSTSGKELKFASEHNRIIYDLAKSVWGSKKDTEKADGEPMVKYDLRRRDLVKYDLRRRDLKNVLRMAKVEVPIVADDVTMKNVGRRDLKREYPFLMVAVAKIEKEIGNSIASMALETVDLEKASILEKKAKKLRLADVKLNMQELDLQKEILKLVMEDIDMTVD